MRLIRVEILMFSAAVPAGPWYTVDEHRAGGNLSSELATQRSKNNLVMIAGLLSLGLALIADGMSRPMPRPWIHGLGAQAKHRGWHSDCFC